MAWQFVGSTSEVGTSNGYTVSLNGTLTGGIASSPAQDDIVVVISAFANNASSAPNVTGNNSGAYTGIGTAIHANDTWDTECRPFYQVMGATPDTSLTITRTTNTAYGGATVVHVWRGVDTASPFIGSAQASGTNGNAINPPSYDPAVSDSLVIAGGAGTLAAAAASAHTGLPGSSNAVFRRADGSTADISAVIGNYAYSGSAVDPAAATGATTSTSASWAGFTFAFRMYVPPTQGLTQDSTFDDSTDTFHAPTVTVGGVTLNATLYTNDQVYYSATVTQSGGGQGLTQDTRYDNSQTFYAPTVDLGGAPQSLTATLYENSQTVYAATVTSVAYVTPTLYTNSQTFYAPTVTASIGITADLYSNSQTFYSADVTQGGVNLQPALYSNDQTFYGHVISSGSINLLASLVENSQSFYQPTVAAGAVDIQPTLVSNTSNFFAPSVSSGGAQQLTFQDHVESGWVESGWVSWPYFNSQQFFTAEVEYRQTSGAVSRSKGSRKRVIVEVDGKEYIVPIEGLQEFLDAISEKAERVAEVPKKRKARKQKAVDIKTAPVVTIVSAPVEEIALIQRHIDRTNEIMRQVFEGALQRYLDELEDEETLLWLID